MSVCFSGEIGTEVSALKKKTLIFLPELEDLSWELDPDFSTYFILPLMTQAVTLSLITLLIYSILEIIWSGMETGCKSVICTPTGKTDTVLFQHLFSKNTVFFIAEITS